MSGVAVLAATLAEPLQYDFFRRGLAVATIAGALCGLVGVYVVVRGMSYLGHGLSHAVFGGAAIASVSGVSYLLGAGVWGVLAALAIGRVGGRRGIASDAAIGIVATASFAVGLVIQARSSSVSRSLDAVLFGNVLAVRTVDLVAVTAAAGLAAIVVAVFRRELAFASFDPDVARVSGIAVDRIDALLMIVLAGAVLVSVRVIGALLISAMLVLPAATARLLTDSLWRMLRIAPALGAVSGFGGMYLSWYLDVPSGATITLVATAAFGISWVGADVARRRAAAAADGHGALL